MFSVFKQEAQVASTYQIAMYEELWIAKDGLVDEFTGLPKSTKCHALAL